MMRRVIVPGALTLAGLGLAFALSVSGRSISSRDGRRPGQVAATGQTTPLAAEPSEIVTERARVRAVPRRA